MTDYEVLGDLLIIFAVSTAVVFVFHQFRFPSIAGFLVAGALIGPHGLNLIPDTTKVQVLAEIGIVLLLFTIGIEFSSVQFASARRILAISAPIQVGGTLVLAVFGALAAGSIVLVACCFGLILWTINSFLRVGLARATLRVMATGTESFADLLEGRELWMPMLLARFLKALVGACALLPIGVIAGGPIVLGELLGQEELGILAGVLLGLLYVPIWIYILLGLVLVEAAVALEAKDPVQALQRSWQIASGNRIQLLLFWVVTYVVGFSGVCLCCVGVLFTGAWTSVALVESYARFALPAPEGGWWIDRAQPAAH